MIGWMACVRWRKAWKFSTVELCNILPRATLSRARCRRWCRREKYKQMRRKTLLYAFEKRMKACQSAWRRRKYKPTFSVVAFTRKRMDATFDMWPGAYLFPGTYVPRYRCSPNLSSPVPMFPGTYVPRYRCSPVLYFNSGNYHKSFGNSPHPLLR